MNITLNKKGIAKFRKRHPLIQKEDLEQAKTSTEWINFVDPQQQILGVGYLGEQNKGLGWVLAFEETVIDHAFFEGRFAKAKGKRSSYYQDDTTTAFRVFNGEGDQVGGLTIDLYATYAVFSWYNQTLYQHKQEIVAAFQQIFPEIIGAAEKIRFTADLSESQWIFVETAPEPLLVL